MSSLLKPKNRNKLFAIILIVAVGGAAFYFYGDEMIGFASGLFTFDNDEGIAGQCMVDASLGAYDSEGNIITTKTLQSGYYIEGSEVSMVKFTIKITFSGDYIDWSTLSLAGSKLMIYPNGQDPVEGTNLELSNDFQMIGDDQKSGTIVFAIMDKDLYTMQEGDDDNIYLEEALGDPIKTLDDGTDVFLLQMVYEIKAQAIDFKDNVISAGADVIGTWELSTLPDGTLKITVDGDGQVTVDTDDLEDEIIDDIPPSKLPDIEKDLFDGDLDPDLHIEPKDSTFAAA